jgi:cytochrome c biogenesis protein CcmG, thiol:disulfide interchange protein DsbE
VAPSAWRRLLLPAAVVLAVVLVVVLLTQRWAEPAQVSVSGGPARVGAPAPDFTTQDLEGHAVRLSALKGKPVIVNFWATWCTACQGELPAIQHAADANIQAGLTVLAADYRETDRPAMRRFLDRVGVRPRALVDPAGQIADAYGVSVGLPVSIFIDRTGTVVAIQLGALTSPQLAADLEKVLA